MGLGSEQAIHEADLIGDKQSKNHADESSDQGEMPADRSNTCPGVGKGGTHGERDQHHPHHGSYAEYDEIRNRPRDAANGRQHQESDRRRTRKPVLDVSVIAGLLLTCSETRTCTADIWVIGVRSSESC